MVADEKLIDGPGNEGNDLKDGTDSERLPSPRCSSSPEQAEVNGMKIKSEPGSPLASDVQRDSDTKLETLLGVPEDAPLRVEVDENGIHLTS